MHDEIVGFPKFGHIWPLVNFTAIFVLKFSIFVCISLRELINKLNMVGFIHRSNVLFI